MENPEFDKLLANLKPDIERLVRKVDTYPAACVTGFIFSMNPRALLKFGNVENQGDNLISLHLTLSTLAATAQQYKDVSIGVPFAELQHGQPLGCAPEEIADELAHAVLVSAMETGHAEKCLKLAQEYIISRKTEKR